MISCSWLDCTGATPLSLFRSHPCRAGRRFDDLRQTRASLRYRHPARRGGARPDAPLWEIGNIMRLLCAGTQLPELTCPYLGGEILKGRAKPIEPPALRVDEDEPIITAQQQERRPRGLRPCNW